MAYRIKPAIRMLVKCEMCVRYGFKKSQEYSSGVIVVS